MTEDKAINMPMPVSFRKRVMYGVMGSAAGVVSLLAGTCLSRCNGCMGCLAGGAGLVGIIAGSKMVEKFSGPGKGRAVPVIENKIKEINKERGT